MWRGQRCIPESMMSHVRLEFGPGLIARSRSVPDIAASLRIATGDSARRYISPPLEPVSSLVVIATMDRS